MADRAKSLVFKKSRSKYNPNFSLIKLSFLVKVRPISVLTGQKFINIYSASQTTYLQVLSSFSKGSTTTTRHLNSVMCLTVALNHVFVTSLVLKELTINSLTLIISESSSFNIIISGDSYIRKTESWYADFIFYE